MSLARLRSDAGLLPVEVRGDGPLVDALSKWRGLVSAAKSVEEPSEVPASVPLCSCNLLEMRGDQVAYISPKDVLARAGVQGNYAAWVIEAKSLDELDSEQGAPLLYDPRLREVAVSTREVRDLRGTHTELIIMGRLEDGGITPQTVPKVIDASQGLDLRFISPETATMRLERKAPSTWREIYKGVAGDVGVQRQAGFQGLQYTIFPGAEQRELNRQTGMSLAFGQKYRITISNGQQIEFQTQPAPDRSWTFEGKATRPYRKAFLRSVRKLEPGMRKIVGQLDGYLTIKVSPNGELSVFSPHDPADMTPNSWATITFAEGMLSTPGGRQEVVAHELSHAVDWFGLNSRDVAELDRMTRKSKKWRNCRPSGRRPGAWQLVSRWPCIEMLEVRAEIMAFAANRGRNDRNTGYGVPTRLLPGATVRKWYRESFAMIGQYDSGADVTDPEWLADFCGSYQCK